MIRNFLIAALLILMTTGPFIAIGIMAKMPNETVARTKTMCHVAGAACEDGPTLLPAIARLK
ncbi:MAG: hypothetical protein AAGL24_26390 [Pseudomonadota bacterium]